MDTQHQFMTYTSGHPGPVVLLVGGIHGNEPAGLQAIQQVFHTLKAHNIEVLGEIVGFKGNLRAIEQDLRFIDVDLNRVWDMPHEKLVNAPHERHEFHGLKREIDAYLTRPDVVLFDLHTTSGKGAPFFLVSRQGPSREFAEAIPVPVVSGLIDGLEGTLVSYVQKHQKLAFAAEGGQHHHPDSLRNLTSMLWCFLHALGCIKSHSSFVESFGYLSTHFGHFPSSLDLTYRHPVTADCSFRMMPGYSNFMQVIAGEVLAHDCSGPVPSPFSGRILMPLYQGKGEDGFFIAKEV